MTPTGWVLYAAKALGLDGARSPQVVNNPKPIIPPHPFDDPASWVLSCDPPGGRCDDCGTMGCPHHQGVRSLQRG